MMPRRTRKSRDHVTMAVLARITSALFMALMGAFAKAASSGGAGLGEVIFFRQAMALPVILVWIITGPGLQAVRSDHPRAHLTRAVIGLSSMGAMFYAINLLPLAEALTIFFIAPLVATSLSTVMLGEKVGRHRWLAILIGFLGVVLIMQPGGSHAEIPQLGLAMAILGAVLMALVTITIRQLSATETEAATVFRFAVIGTAASGCLYPFFYQPHEPFVWLMLIGVGVSGAVIQITTAISLKLAPISITAPFDYSQLFWAVLIGWLIWADLPAWTTVAGGLLIAGSGLFTFYRERLHRQTIAEEATPVN